MLILRDLYETLFCGNEGHEVTFPQELEGGIQVAPTCQLSRVQITAAEVTAPASSGNSENLESPN